MTPIAVVIPVRNELELTSAIVDHLLQNEQLDLLIIMDNGSTDDTWDWLLERGRTDYRLLGINAADMPYYAMWNLGTRLAVDRLGSECYVGIFNNDIAIPEGTLDALSAVLDADERVWVACPDHLRSMAEGVAATCVPTTVVGTFRHHGMPGFCFLFRGNTPIKFDEGFEIWFADDDWVFSIIQAGGLIKRLTGWPIDHIGSVTLNKRDLSKEIAEDTKRFRDRWGDI